MELMSECIWTLVVKLKPWVSRTLFGQPFVTNAFGMHDDHVTIEKPEGSFRIAVLGASMDMGWGVRYQDTYINRLQGWLNAGARAPAPGGPRRYEVLNFAVAAYSPLQRLETLRRKVLAFEPDLVIYSATMLDLRLMEIHLCDALRTRSDLTYGFVRKVLDRAGVGPEELRLDGEGKLVFKEQLKAKLLLQIHDELVVEFPPEERDRVESLVVEEMSSAAQLAVPLKVDVHVGPNWAACE